MSLFHHPQPAAQSKSHLHPQQQHTYPHRHNININPNPNLNQNSNNNTQRPTRQAPSYASLPNKQQSRKSTPYNARKLSEVMEDLCMRFIVNLPEEDYESFERLFFAIESAHWFYDDFYRENDHTLPRLQLKPFTSKLFEHTSLLSPYRDHVDHLVSQFQTYKKAVPTCGAALLNHAMDQVVIVRGWGREGRWGFPKGKVSKNETELECAIREVLEETGFDMTPYVDQTTDFIESFSTDRYLRIFVVPGIPHNIQFETHTRKEISDIMWIPVHLLPDSVRNAKLGKHPSATKENLLDEKGHKMLFAQHTLASFTKRLRAWIKREKKRVDNLPQVQMDSSFDQPLSLKEVETLLFAKEVLADTQLKLEPVEEPALLQEQNDQQYDQKNGQQDDKQADQPSASVKIEPRLISPAKSHPKKSKRLDFRQESSRNRTTFGSDAAESLSKHERSALFLRYVMETDRIKAEQGLTDEFWPVPYITSEDFTEEEKREANAALPHQPANTNGRIDHPDHPDTRSGRSVNNNSQTCAPPSKPRRRVLDVSPIAVTPMENFAFDWKAIRDCMHPDGPL